MKDFNNKIAFITGGSSGIGLATAKQLAARGAHIVIFARKEEQLKIATAEIEQKAINTGQKFNWFSMDVADNNDIKVKLDQAVAEYKTPDIFINCAGISIAAKFEDITCDQFDNLIKINLSGTRNATAAIVPHMKKAGSGTIVIVASSAGLIPVYGYTAYGTSKYALVGLAECLRTEMRPENIDVLVLCPPEVDTPLVEEEEKTSPPETKLLKHLAGKLSVEATAATLIRGIEKNRFRIIPGLMAKILYYTQRFSPGFIFRGSSDLLVWIARKRK